MSMFPILFRAWDRVCHQFVNPNKVYLNGSVVVDDTWATRDIVLQQFTGVKDINGTKIYEGDYVHANGRLSLVVRCDFADVKSGNIRSVGGFCLENVGGGPGNDGWQSLFVVGNIFEGYQNGV